MVAQVKQQLRLQTKAFLLVSAAVLIISLITLTLIVVNSARELREESFGKVREIAHQHSHDIEKELGDTMGMARAYAVSVHGILAWGNGDRRASIMKNTQKFLDFLPPHSAVWALFEPGVLAAPGKGRERADGDRFTPYAYREGGRLVKGDAGLWDTRYAGFYRTTSQARKETVSEVYRGAGVATLMTSFCVPIIDDGKIIGVAGIDLVLSDLSDRLGKIRPLDEKSFAFMVSNSGIFVAHPWPVYLAHNIAEPKFGTPAKIIDAIRRGSEISEVRTSPLTGLRWYVYFVPVKIGKSDAPWSFGINVPLHTVLEKSRNLVWASVINGALSSVVLLIALFVIVRTISTPVQKTLSDLNKAIEQASDAVCIIGPDRKIKFVNPAMEKISGKPANSLIGEAPLLKNREGVQAEEIWRILDEGNIWTGCITDDPSRFNLEMTITPIRDQKGAIRGYLEVGRDITRELHMEEQLRQSQKMEAVGTLAGGIAHDFNNILTTIMGYGSLLQMNIDRTSPLNTYVDPILSAARKAADLTKGLLAFSRQQPVALAPLDINDTIKGAGKLLERLLTEDINLRISFTADNTVVMADKTQVDQILFNLATNARDAMPKGGTIAIETDTVDVDDEFMKVHGFEEPGRYVEIRVSDTGMGMDEATLENIFDPFFTTKEVGKGTGLGLATVYGIVKRHNGHITVESEPNRGATFHVYLRAASAAVGEEERQTVSVEKGAETILIAEDNEDVRRFLGDVLRQYGYRTIEAADGEDAIQKFAQNRDIDLIIIDSVMPGKNGREVYEEVRRMEPHIRAIFTSGYTRDIVLDKGIEDRELDFIAKPVSPVALLEKVREVLARNRGGRRANPGKAS